MAVIATSDEFQPLPTTREQRGRAIAQRGGIRQLGARYVVPAQSANSNVPTYLVDVVEQTCTCPDFQLRFQPCKHYEACMFWLAWEGAVNMETGEIALPKKQQSKQNWPAYNRAQTTERVRLPQFLYAISLGIPDADRAPGTSGRKPIPDREALFGLVAKVYSGCSGRRAEGDMHAYVERGYLSRAWDSNTLFRAMESPAMTPILTWAVEESGGPLAQVENAAGQFAVDATGFKTTVRRVKEDKEVSIERWFDQKHKSDDEQKLRKFIHDWIKLHAATGTLTNVVTAARVTAGMGDGTGDTSHFRDLVNTTARRFIMKEVSADKAYLGKNNLAVVAAVGAQPFIPFKITNERAAERNMRNPSEHWRKMWAYFDLKKEEFLRHYHRRSNVESTFGALKAKFGGSVRSKKFVAQQNEVLAKVLLWNLTCIISAIEEFGVEAEFSRLVMP
ncbi:MAG TPA: transposase [Kofleriaceae bacterium]|jgi:hypothetical protein